jgi:hypothetical protein
MKHKTKELNCVAGQAPGLPKEEPPLGSQKS